MMQAGLGAFSPSRVGVAQPVGLSPGQARPDMPNIPQIKPSGTGQAAALPSKVDYLVGIPREYLLQALMSPAEDPPKWAIVTALDQQAKEADIKKRAEGAAAQRQVAGLGTVVQDVATRRLARGGVVGFQAGGNPEIERILKKSPYSRTPEENEKLKAAGIPLVQRTLPADSGLSRFNRWLESPFIREAITRGALNLSDEDLAKRTDTAASNEKIARSLLGAQQVLPATAPTAAATAYDPAADVARENYLLQQRRPGPSAASAAPANRRGLGTGTGTGKPQPTSPPAANTPPPQTDGFDIKALQDAMRAAGTVSPAVQMARDALEKQRQASLSARERRREAVASEGRSYGQLARAMVGAKSFGEALALAAGAAADQRAEKNKRLQELDDAADRLREALAEKALADRSADDAARKQADVEVLKAQRDYLDKQRTFRIQEQDAQARTVAAERSGSSGESRGLSAQVTGLNNLIRAADDTMNNMMLKQEVRDAAARDKARHIRSLEALLSGNSSLSGMSTADLLKMLGSTGGATR